MARLTSEEKQAARQRESALHSFNNILRSAHAISDRIVYKMKDGYTDDGLGKSTKHVLAVVYDIVTKREELLNDQRYLVDRLTEDCMRISKGRESDDITRNSSFSNIAQRIALFNYRLREVHAMCENEKIYVAELYPTMTHAQLEECVLSAKELYVQMLRFTENDVVADESLTATCREKLMNIERRMR